MHKFDIAVIIYFFGSLFLFGDEEVVTPRFKSKVMRIILQQGNDRFIVNNMP